MHVTNLICPEEIGSALGAKEFLFSEIASGTPLLESVIAKSVRNKHGKLKSYNDDLHIGNYSSSFTVSLNKFGTLV